MPKGKVKTKQIRTAIEIELKDGSTSLFSEKMIVRDVLKAENDKIFKDLDIDLTKKVKYSYMEYNHDAKSYDAKYDEWFSAYQVAKDDSELDGKEAKKNLAKWLKENTEPTPPTLKYTNQDKSDEQYEALVRVMVVEGDTESLIGNMRKYGHTLVYSMIQESVTLNQGK